MTVHPEPPSDIIVDPIPQPIDPAVARLAQRARISIPHAAVIAQLAGMGEHAGRASR